MKSVFLKNHAKGIWSSILLISQISSLIFASASHAQEDIALEEPIYMRQLLESRCKTGLNWMEDSEEVYEVLAELYSHEESEPDQSPLDEFTINAKAHLEQLGQKALDLINSEIETCISIHRTNQKISEHTINALSWHHASTIFIFLVVHIILFFGLWLTKQQFDQRDIHGLEQAPATELKIDSLGISVKSPIIGVIILLISLVFFTIYVKDVYPINPISLGEGHGSTGD